jgi:hypothetical protein
MAAAGNKHALEQLHEARRQLRRHHQDVAGQRDDRTAAGSGSRSASSAE